MANKRRNIIIEELKKHGRVEIDPLASLLEVSPMTIRRDLMLLEQEGELIRSFGGAVLPQVLVKETPFREKATLRKEQKKQIALKALELIKDGQTLLLDSGTTTLELARLLKWRNHLTVMTNDIKIAAELIDSALRVIIIGGEMQNDIGAVFGAQALQFIETVHVDLFFLGAQAIDISAGVTSPSIDKSHLKQQMIKAAASTWLLADSNKLNRKAFSQVCDLSSLTGFISDSDMSSSMETKIKEHVGILHI